MFRNVGIQNSDAGKLPRRKYTTYRTRRKFEIKDMKLSYAIPEPEPMLATPESVDSSSASPESGVLAAEVFVLDPSLCNENSPARKIK